METLIQKVKSLLLSISDDENDYPDMQSYRIIQDKVQEVQEEIDLLESGS